MDTSNAVVPADETVLPATVALADRLTRVRVLVDDATYQRLTEQALQQASVPGGLDAAYVAVHQVLVTAEADAAESERTYEGLSQTLAAQVTLATQRLKCWQALDALTATQCVPAALLKRVVDALLVPAPAEKG